MKKVTFSDEKPIVITLSGRGPQGRKGDKGDSATIEVGTTTTLPAGSPATVVNRGTEQEAILDFGIPEGQKGETGSTGPRGETGPSGKDGLPGAPASVHAGTVTTLPAGSQATVENVGTEQDAIFNFGIPQGQKGDTGDDGITPNVNVTEISGGHNVAFDYGQGDSRNRDFDVMDGHDGASQWGAITGNIKDQTDLAKALDDKADKSVITYTESAMKATRNYVIGDLIIVGTALYKATANISSGANLTVNTNVVATTLAAENALKANSEDVYAKNEVYNKTETDVLMFDKADVILDTASGAIASIEDGAPYPVEELTVDINPVQDLHGYDAPWPAGARNKLNLATDDTVVFNLTIVSEGETIKLTGTSGGVGYGYFSLKNTVTLPAGIYYLGCQIDKRTNLTGVGIGSSNAYLGGITNISTSGFKGETFTLAEETTITRLRVTVPTGNTANEEFRVIISADAVTSWYPYSNICPIMGHDQTIIRRTGKVVGEWNYSFNNNGSYSKTISLNSYPTECQAMLDMLKNLKPGNYTYGVLVNNCETSQTRGISVRFTDNTTISFVARVENGWYTYSITIPEGLKNKTLQYIALYYGKSSGGVAPTSADVGYLKLSLADDTPEQTDTYQDESVTISLGSTVYGGVLDVKNGVMTIGWAMADLSTLGFSYSSNWHCWFLSGGISGAKIVPNNTTKTTAICSVAKAIISSGYSTSHDVGTFAQNGNGQWFLDNGSTTELTGQLLYELATPIVITGLIPAQMSTLLGENAIWADTGNVDLTYRADTKLYIDGKIEEDTRSTRNMIAGEETEMKATRNYTAKEYLWVGDDLYKVTANISNGSNLTVGTNVSKCTVGEQLKLALS